MKNVFPPSRTFHITSTVNDALVADVELACTRIPPEKDGLARESGDQETALANIRCSWLQLLKVHAEKVKRSGAKSIRYLMLYSPSVSVKVNRNPQTRSPQTTGGQFVSNVDFSTPQFCKQQQLQPLVHFKTCSCCN